MSDLLSTFKQKAESLVSAITDVGGIQATIASLRRQMAEGDRRREITKVRAELKRLDAQIQEMITAIGVQAVGLHKSGVLDSPHLEPLCQHIIELEASVARQKVELAKLEAQAQAANAEARKAAPVGLVCPSCGQPAFEGSSFCAHCGAAIPQQPELRYCVSCGATLRESSAFCAKCGQKVPEADA